MCMGISHVRNHDLAHHLFGCTEWVFGRRSFDSFPAEVSQSSSPNSLVVHSHQNQYYALVWGSCTDCCCSGVLGLHLALKFSFAPRACGNIESLTY
jgi:hypothetical protein